jgi:hypothetical protein
MGTLDGDLLGDDEDTGTGALGALVNIGSNYTTQEAHDIAKNTFNELYSGRKKYAETENQYMDQMATSAVQAKMHLHEAREKLLRERYNKAQMWFALAQGFLSPTRGGGFGESLGNAVGLAREPLAKEQEWNQNRDKQALDYALQSGSIDQNLAAQRLKLMQMQGQMDSRLMSESLRVLGREIRPGANTTSTGGKPMSPEGKQAQDEGYMVGSRAYYKRVRFLASRNEQRRRETAGIDVTEPTAQDKSKLAGEFGVPIADNDPYVGLSTKARQAAMQARARENQKTLETLGTDDPVARQAISDAQRFMFLNKQTPSGPLYGIPGIKQITGFSTQAQELDRLTAKLARKEKQPGEGQISNFDAAQFILASPSRGKNRTTNDNINKATVLARRQQLQYSEFLSNYAAVNGHMIGAKEAWNRYLQANPIFDPSRPGSFSLNNKRVSYKDWFRVNSHVGALSDPRPVGQPASDLAEPPTGAVGEDPRESDPVYAGLDEEAMDEADRPAMAEGGQVAAPEGDVDWPSDSDMLDPSYRVSLKDLGRAAAQGLAYNYGDEGLALLSHKPYDQALLDERAALEQFSDNAPFTALGTEVAGAVPTGSGIGAATHFLGNKLRGGKGKAATAARLIDKVLPKSLLGKMVLSGAGSGFLAGTGSAQGDQSRLGAGVEGGALGGIFGPLAGLGAKYGLGLSRRGIDWLTGAERSPGREKVIEAIAKDGMQLSDVEKKLAADHKAGVPAMVGDVGGKNLDALTEAVVGRPGEGAAGMATKIENRQAAAPQRVEGQINKALAPDQYHTKLDELNDLLYTQSKPLYEAAYKNTKPVPVKDVSWLFDFKEGKKALKDAVNLMNADGIPIGRKDVTGNVKSMGLQTLDYTKRALDDIISKEEANGSTNRGRILRNARNRLRDYLDNVSPDYAKARAQYAGDLEVRDALKMGREEFGKLGSEELRRKVANMSFAEKDALKTGVAQHLFEQMAKTPKGSNVARHLVGTTGAEEKLAALFDKPSDAAKFLTTMQREFEIFRKSQGTITRARAARAAAATAGLESAPLSEAADVALDAGQQAVFMPGFMGNTGGPWTAARMMQWVRNRMPMTEKTANDAAGALGTDNPADAKRLLERLQQEASRLEKRTRVSNTVGMGATRASAVTAQPDPWDDSPEVETETP